MGSQQAAKILDGLPYYSTGLNEPSPVFQLRTGDDTGTGGGIRAIHQ